VRSAYVYPLMIGSLLYAGLRNMAWQEIVDADRQRCG
jgi:hypothetical protein